MQLLPLFIHGKLGTSKIDCADKIRESHVYLHSLWELDYDR